MSALVSATIKLDIDQPFAEPAPFMGPQISEQAADHIIAAQAELTAAGKAVRVVSMPSTDAFDKQDEAYRESVLPSSVTKRIAVEAGIADFWYKYVGFGGKIIGMTTFGESAPAGELFKMFGFTTENVVNTAKELLA